MENPNATWNDSWTRIIQNDVSFQFYSKFLDDEEQTESQLATLGQKKKNVRLELREQRVNAVEGDYRTADPNQNERQNATRFCKYCCTNGHTPSWCHKKIRDEELRRIENERTAERKVTYTQDYKKIEDLTMDQNIGLEAKISREDTRTILPIDLGEIPALLIRTFPRGQSSHMGVTIRLLEDHMINAQISHSIEAMVIDLEMDLPTIRMEPGKTMGTSLVLHWLKVDFSQNSSNRQPKRVLRRSDNRSTTALHPTNQKFHKTTFRRHLMWFALPQAMIQWTIYLTSVRGTTKVSELDHRQISKLQT